MLQAEKETRESWIKRHEKEQLEHTETAKQLLQAKSDCKDAQLASKNAEIEVATLRRQVEVLSGANNTLQTQSNETSAKNETIERDLHTQKEIMKQAERTAQEHIQRLRNDLDSVEERYEAILNHINMASEDNRSMAYLNHHKLVNLQLQYDERCDEVKELKSNIEYMEHKMKEMRAHEEFRKMQFEDLTCNIFYKEEGIQGLKDEIEEKVSHIKKLDELKNGLSLRITQLSTTLEEKQKVIEAGQLQIDSLEDTKHDLERQLKNLRAETDNDKQELENKIASLTNEMEQLLNVERLDQEVQTDILMDYFDQVTQLHKIESRMSGQSQRVGGGGSVSKPPRASDKRLSSKNPSDLNATGVNMKSEHSSQRQGPETNRTLRQTGNNFADGSKPSLPNLLKNSQSAHRGSQQSNHPGDGAEKQNSQGSGKQGIAQKSSSSRKEEGQGENATIIQEENSTDMGTIRHEGNAQASINAGGTIMQTLAVGDGESMTGVEARQGHETISQQKSNRSLTNIKNEVIHEDERENDMPGGYEAGRSREKKSEESKRSGKTSTRNIGGYPAAINSQAGGVRVQQKVTNQFDSHHTSKASEVSGNRLASLKEGGPSLVVQNSKVSNQVSSRQLGQTQQIPNINDMHLGNRIQVNIHSNDVEEQDQSYMSNTQT